MAYNPDKPYHPFDSKEEAQEHFYPDAWMFTKVGESGEPKAGYVVQTSSEEERDLAYRVKPMFVDARILSLPTVPLPVRKLKKH